MVLEKMGQEHREAIHSQVLDQQKRSWQSFLDLRLSSIPLALLLALLSGHVSVAGLSPSILLARAENGRPFHEPLPVAQETGALKTGLPKKPHSLGWRASRYC